MRYRMGKFIDNRILYQLIRTEVESQRRQEDFRLKLIPC